MSDLARSIRRHIDALPTCALSIGEYMNKAAVMAGDEPVFLIRSAPIGTLYSEAIVQLLPLMSSAANALSAPASSEPGATNSPTDGSMEARVRSAIEGVASMQPELKGRAPLFSKMLFSAVLHGSSDMQVGLGLVVSIERLPLLPRIPLRGWSGRSCRC